MTLPAEEHVDTGTAFPVERPYYKKSIAGRLRHLASAIGELVECADAGELIHVDDLMEECNPDTLNELADEITDLIGEAIGTQTKGIAVLQEARYGKS